MRKGRPSLKPTPFVGFNPFRWGAGPRPDFIAVMAVGDGYLCVEYQLGADMVVLFAAKARHFEEKRYTYSNTSLPALVSELKTRALHGGATLEAIQLLGTLVPLTPEAVSIMASANAKLSRNKADTTGLKDAAKKTPAAGGKTTSRGAVKDAGGGRRGNPEALAKAREARQSAAQENRTYKVLKKSNEAREGTWTEAMVGHIIGATSTDAAKASLAKDKQYKDRKLDFTWAEKKGYIKFA